MRRGRMDYRRKKLRNIIGILKDKAALLRAALLFTCGASAYAASRRAVLRATSHNTDAPPLDHHVGDLMALGRAHPLAAVACIEALMDRLHSTRSASVALKCLILLHGVATERESGSTSTSSSSSVLRDQLAVFPTYGGHNFLNLSTFLDESDIDMSAWVRWFVGVLEQTMIASRTLGEFSKGGSDEVAAKSTVRILRDLDSLGGLVAEVCGAPESMHMRRNDLVYEAVMRAGKDYGFAQREIAFRVRLIGHRIGDLSPGEEGETRRTLKGLEDCRERLGLLLGSRKMNQPFWDLIGGTAGELGRRQRERDERMLVAAQMAGRGGESGDFARCIARVAGRPEQLFRVAAPGGGGSSLLDNGRMALTFPPVV